MILVATAVTMLATRTAATPPPGDWPVEGARSIAGLCRWFTTHVEAGATRPTCRSVCVARRGSTQAVVLRRGSGFHEGLAVAVRERGVFRVVHDDVDDEDGVVIQGGAWGSIAVRACRFAGDASPAFTFDVHRQQTGDPPNACDVTRDVQRVTCTQGNAGYACTRAIVEAKVTTRDPNRACEP